MTRNFSNHPKFTLTIVLDWQGYDIKSTKYLGDLLFLMTIGFLLESMLSLCVLTLIMHIWKSAN